MRQGPAAAAEPGEAELAGMRRLSSKAEGGPRFSILVPVYGAAEEWLRRLADSVFDQVYPRWELCLADDASPSPHVRRVLEELAAARTSWSSYSSSCERTLRMPSSSSTTRIRAIGVGSRKI